MSSSLLQATRCEDLPLAPGKPIHIYPLHGKAHELEGTSCWCRPDLEMKKGHDNMIVIHRGED